MQPFAGRGVGEAYLHGHQAGVPATDASAGIADMSQVSATELDAYVDLLRREDGGAAFLQIMRGSKVPGTTATPTSARCAAAGTRCRSCGASATAR